MFITAIPSSLALVPGSIARSRTSTPRCCAASSTPAEKFVERGLDTLEDALLHFRRLSREGINVEDSLATWDDPNDPRRLNMLKVLAVHSRDRGLVVQDRGLPWAHRIAKETVVCSLRLDHWPDGEKSTGE